MPTSVEISNIVKKYGELAALDGVSCNIEESERIMIVCLPMPIPASLRPIPWRCRESILLPLPARKKGLSINSTDRLVRSRTARWSVLPPIETFEGRHRSDSEEFYRLQKSLNLDNIIKERKKYDEFFNNERPHMGLHGLTPLQKLQSFSDLKGVTYVYS